MPKPPHPVDAAWLRLCDEQGAAYDCLIALVSAIRDAGSPLARRGQEALRRSAADALARLRLDTWERDGVRLTLVAARTTVADGVLIVLSASYVRVSLDPQEARRLRLREAMAAKGGATIVDLLERRAARRNVA